MAVKRRAAADSDTEEGGSQAQKRARVQGDSDIEVDDAPQASGSRSTQRKQKASEAADVDEDEDDIQQVAPDADEEKRFEQEHEDAIRERVFGGHRGQGVSEHSTIIVIHSNHRLVKQSVAEMGIIERIDMHNFMCHKYLTFNFGPQINFIIGMCRVESLYTLH